MVPATGRIHPLATMPLATLPPAGQPLGASSEASWRAPCVLFDLANPALVGIP